MQDKQESEFLQKEPCPSCGSRDNLARYDDGHGFCFGCGYYEHPNGNSEHREVKRLSKDMIPLGKFIDLSKRGIRQETCERFGYFIGEWKDGRSVQVANYRDQTGAVCGQKVRLPGKEFTTTGDFKSVVLFGQHLWKRGGKQIVITEGEIDCLTLGQVMPTWPVVSLPNGALSAVKAIKKNLEFLETYEKVILFFDMDEAGQKAVQECVDLFTPGKCAVAQIPLKDPNEMLVAGRVKELTNAVWEAQIRRPDGIVQGIDLWDRVSTPIPEGVSYPWSGMNSLSFGMRPCEIITFTAGSGVGKSAVTAEIMHHLAMVEKKSVGIAMLEEGLDRSARRFMGIHLNQPLHLPIHRATPEQLRAAFDATLGSGRFHFVDAFGSMDADLLLNRFKYLVKGLGCQFILLDHLSMLASGADTDDERRFIDTLMTKLRSFTQETRATLINVSHLRRPNNDAGHERGTEVSLNQLRGSHAIAQLSDQVWALERDGQSDDPEERNLTTVRALKMRISGMTGIATKLIYDQQTGRLEEQTGFEGQGEDSDHSSDY